MRHLSKILFIIIILSITSISSTQVYYSGKVIDRIKVYNNDVGLQKENVFHYQHTISTQKPIPIKIDSTFTNRLLKKEKFTYQIKYDTLANPISIVHKDRNGDIIEEITLEYDQQEVHYPYPDKQVFGFINLKGNTRLRLKKVINHDKDTITYQIPFYKDKYLIRLDTLNPEGVKLKSISYSYDDKNRLKSVEFYDIINGINEYKIYIYDDLNPKSLRYIIKTLDKKHIDEYITVASFSDGNFLREYHYKPQSKIKIPDFSPYEYEFKSYMKKEYHYKFSTP
jgi:hypothetical protein